MSTALRSIQPLLKRSQHRALAAAALLLCTPVFAASSGSFSTGPISFQLIDLRPDDGIAPSVSFQKVSGQEGGVAAQAAQLSPLQLELRAQYRSWADSRIDSATDLAKAKARVQGGGSQDGLGGAMLSGNGAARDFAGPTDAAAGFLAQAVLGSNGESIRLTLSPWTALVATFDTRVKLASTRAGDAADSTVELRLGLDGQEAHHDELHFECSGPCQLAEGRALYVTVQNESDLVVGGEWWAMATVQGTAVAMAGSASARQVAQTRARRRLHSLLGATGLAPR